MDSHQGTRAALDLLEMNSSVTTESNIFMFLASPERLTCCGEAGGRRRHLVTSDDVEDISEVHYMFKRS